MTEKIKTGVKRKYQTYAEFRTRMSPTIESYKAKTGYEPTWDILKYYGRGVLKKYGEVGLETLPPSIRREEKTYVQSLEPSIWGDGPYEFTFDATGYSQGEKYDVRIVRYGEKDEYNYAGLKRSAEKRLRQQGMSVKQTTLKNLYIGSKKQKPSVLRRKDGKSKLGYSRTKV